MKQQKVIDNTPNQPSKSMPINGLKERMIYLERMTPIEQTKLKTSLLKSRFCDYSDVYMLVKGTITDANTAAAADNPNNIKKVMLKNCVSFTHCISKTNNTQVHNVKNIDVVMPMYNLIEYSNNYSKTSGILWQYYRDEPALDANGTIADFPIDNNNSVSFKFKQKIKGQTGNDGTKDVEVMMQLSYLTLELLQYY